MKSSARSTRVAVSADGRGLVSQAGAVLLWETMRVTGLGRGLSAALQPWRGPQAVHDPGKIVADLAAALALGGDCLADIAVLREQPDLAGPVASDPVVSRLAKTLAAAGPAALAAIRGARAAARERAWALAGDAGSNTAADHIEAAGLALAQLPRHLRRNVLVRADSGGGTHEFLTWLTAKSRRLHYSVGMTITQDVQDAIGTVPADAWTPAYDSDGKVREGAWVADITGLLELDSWPAGMRLIVRKERPHPGAQLRFTDIDGHRFTCFATDAKKGQLAVLELRHRRRARCEDRIRCAKDTGLRNLPLKGFDQNQLWCEIVALACELLAWTQMLALAGAARQWEPKRLRLRLFCVAGRLASSGRHLRLRLAGRWPWAADVTAATARLQALPFG